MPLLLAEGDRDAYRRQQAALAREKEIMKDVKDWEVSLFSDTLVVQSLDLLTVDVSDFSAFAFAIGIVAGREERVPQSQIPACGQYCGAVTVCSRHACTSFSKTRYTAFWKQRSPYVYKMK